MVERFIGSGRMREGGRAVTPYQSFIAHTSGGDLRHDASMIDTDVLVDGYNLESTLGLIQDSINTINSTLSTLNTTIDTLVEQGIDLAINSIQIQNWYDSVNVQTGLVAVHAVYAEEDDLWIIAGNDGYLRSSTTGSSWSTITSGVSNDFTYVFDIAVDGYSVVVLDETDDTIFVLPDGTSTISSREQTSGDQLHVGIYDSVIGKVIIVGKPAGGATGDLLFLTSAPGALLAADMERVTGLSLAASTMHDKHIATNGAGRVLCLVGFNNRTAMYVIVKNTGVAAGVSVTLLQTTTAITINASGVDQVTGLAYDSVGVQWVAATLDGRIWTSPVGAETWTLLVNLSTSLVKFVIHENLWVSVNSTGLIIYSSDGGTTWRSWINSAAGTALAFSEKLQQWLIVNNATAAVSLSVGLTGNLVT
jgi:hypothetical protein